MGYLLFISYLVNGHKIERWNHLPWSVYPLYINLDMNAHLLMYDEFEVLTCANFEYTMQIQWSMGLQVIYIRSKWVTKILRVIVFHVMVKEITNYLITNNWGNVFCDVKSWKYDYDEIFMKLRSFQVWGFFNR